jgi:integrase
MKIMPIRPGSVAMLSLEYRRSPEFQNLSQSTRHSYERALKIIEEHYHKYAIASIKRRHVKALRDAYMRKPAEANLIVSMFSILMKCAIDMEYREANPASNIPKLRLGHYERWPDEAIDYAIANLPERFVRPIIVALYTGQRQGDVLTMTWSDYDGEGIKVVQQKTGAELWIPCHHILKAHLDRWKESRTSTHICTTSRGKPWKVSAFHVAFPREKKQHIELTGLRFHGLRKTAAAKLAEAGCSTHEIAAITGHTTLAMLELYTRQAEQKTRARAAIVKLEARK